MRITTQMFETGRERFHHKSLVDKWSTFILFLSFFFFIWPVSPWLECTINGLVRQIAHLWQHFPDEDSEATVVVASSNMIGLNFDTLKKETWKPSMYQC